MYLVKIKYDYMRTTYRFRITDSALSIRVAYEARQLILLRWWSEEVRYLIGEICINARK
jgi:hypothetical protein